MEDGKSGYLGGLIIIVIGYVDEKMAHKWYEGKGLLWRAFEQVEKAV